MRGNGRGRIFKPRFGRFEAKGKLNNAALHCLKQFQNSGFSEDLAAYEFLKKLYKQLVKGD